MTRYHAIIIAALLTLFAIATMMATRVDRTPGGITASYPPPRLTDQFIMTGGLAGPGIQRAQYPYAHELIRRSGCVREDGYFGSAQMNCVLDKTDLPFRVAHASPVGDSLQRLDDWARSQSNGDRAGKETFE